MLKLSVNTNYDYEKVKGVSAMNITKDIKYVGVNDHDIDLFEGQYVVENGMAYNSYVIIDEKIAVMDTVDARFRHEWLDNLADALDGRKPDERVVDDLLKTLGLTERVNHLPNQLSGGQQQRVSIGRALINNPALMLADEPTGNLDSENSREIVSLLRKFNKENNQTVIIITHDERIAMSADRVISIEDGKITRDEVRKG